MAHRRSPFRRKTSKNLIAELLENKTEADIKKGFSATLYLKSDCCLPELRVEGTLTITVNDPKPAPGAVTPAVQSSGPSLKSPGAAEPLPEPTPEQDSIYRGSSSGQPLITRLPRVR